MYNEPQTPFPMMPPPPAPPMMGVGSGGSIDPSILGLLRNMEKEDLQRLDERTIDSLLADDKDLRDLADQKVTEHASNRSLAEHSLTFQSRLDQSKRSLTAAHKEAAEQSRIHRELRERIQRGGRRPGEQSMESLHTLLQSACLEAEESAEALLEAFLANRMQLADFANGYTEARVLYHTRRSKSDKVTEISNQRIVQAAAPFRTTEQPHHYQQQQQPPPPPPPRYQQQQQQPQQQAYGMPPYYYPSPPNYQQYQQPPYGGK